MSNSAADALIQAVTALLQRESKSFLAGHLAQRLGSVETDPRFQYDPVARNIHASVVKVAEANPSQLITAQQLNTLYNGLESLNPNTEFKSGFSDLLPDSVVIVEEPIAPAAPLSRHDYSDFNLLPGQVGDTTEIVGEGDEPEPIYELPPIAAGINFKPEFYRFASSALQFELNKCPVENVNIKHKIDAPGIMIYQASFTTPTGRHNIVIPLRVEAEMVHLPEAFGSADGSRMYAFSSEGIEKFEADNRKIAELQQLRASDALRADSVSVDDSARTLSANLLMDDDIVVEESLLANAGLSDVEDILTATMAVKASKYAPRLIVTATDVVTRELRALGQHSKLVFAGDLDSGEVAFKAKICNNSREAEVAIPVEIKGSQVLFPSTFVIANKEYPLTQSGIATFFSENSKMPEVVLANVDLKKADYNTLRQKIYAACADKQYETAEQALEVIASKFGTEAHNNALKDYREWLVTAKKATGPVCTATKLDSNDWARLLQAELNTITDGKSVEIPEGATFEFAPTKSEPTCDAIITSRIEFT